MFQCPTSGFFLFYDCVKSEERGILWGFNALLRASSFSTSHLQGCKVQRNYCFNALLRASSFSTSTKNNSIINLTSFNALLRASSFSTIMIKKEDIYEKMFQCPTSGFFLFYAMLLHPLILLAFSASIL